MEKLIKQKQKKILKNWIRSFRNINYISNNQKNFGNLIYSNLENRENLIIILKKSNIFLGFLIKHIFKQKDIFKKN